MIGLVTGADTANRTLCGMTQPTEYAPYDGVISLDTLPALFASRRATFGGYRMEGPGGTTTASTDTGTATTDGGGTAAGATTTADASQAAGATASTASTASTDTSKTFTQADLDRIINARLTQERKAFDEKLAEVQATAGKSDLEAAQIKAQAAEEKVTTVTKSSALRVAGAEAKLAAHLAGAKKDRLDAVLKQADLTSAVSEDGDVDEAKVAAAIDAVLTQYPEWKAATTATSSGGELTTSTGGEKPTFTRKQLQDMSQEEYEKNSEAIKLAMAEGRITG